MFSVGWLFTLLQDRKSAIVGAQQHPRECVRERKELQLQTSNRKFLG